MSWASKSFKKLGKKIGWTNLRMPLAYAGSMAAIASGIGAAAGMAGLAGLAGTTTGALAAGGAIMGGLSGAQAGVQANEAAKDAKQQEKYNEEALKAASIQAGRQQTMTEASQNDQLAAIMKKSAFKRSIRTAGQQRFGDA